MKTATKEKANKIRKSRTTKHESKKRAKKHESKKHAKAHAPKHHKKLNGKSKVIAAKTDRPLTKTQLVSALSECVKEDFVTFGMKESKVRKAVGMVVDNLTDVAYKELKRVKQFNFPKLMRMKRIHKAKRPAGERMAFGKLIQVKAKPACFILRAYVAKGTKDAVL